MEERNVDDKFTTIIKDNNLSFPEFGDVINDGENDLVVCAVEKIDNNDYVLLCDEKTKKVAVYEVRETANKFNYYLVNDDIILGKLALNIVKKNDNFEGEE